MAFAVNELGWTPPLTKPTGVECTLSVNYQPVDLSESEAKVGNTGSINYQQKQETKLLAAPRYQSDPMLCPLDGEDDAVISYEKAATFFLLDPSAETANLVLIALSTYNDFNEELAERLMMKCVKLSQTHISDFVPISCLILKHWILLPVAARMAYPSLLLNCLRSLENVLQLQLDHKAAETRLELVANCWCLAIEQCTLTHQESRYLFSLVLGYMMADSGRLDDQHSSPLQRCTYDLLLSIYTVTPEHIRASLAAEVVNKWTKEGSATRIVASLLTSFVALSGQMNVTVWSKAYESGSWEKVSNIANNNHTRAVELADNICQLIMKNLCYHSRLKKSLLFDSLMKECVDLFWRQQKASAEPLLVGFAAELVASRTKDPRLSRTDLCVRALAHFHSLLHFMHGPLLNLSSERLVATAKDTDQVLYLATRLSSSEKECLAEIYVATIYALSGQERSPILPSEWRDTLRNSRLPFYYREIGSALLHYARVSNFSSALQVKVLHAVHPLIESSPNSFGTVLLDCLHYASPRVCLALIPVAHAAMRGNHPQALEILRRLGARLAAPCANGYKLALANLCSELVPSSPKISSHSFVLLLVILADADDYVVQQVSRLARAGFLDAIGPNGEPSERLYDILQTISRSRLLVCRGLHSLSTSMTKAEKTRLNDLTDWLCRRNDRKLVSLMARFCNVAVSREHLYLILKDLKEAPSYVKSLELETLVGALSTQQNYTVLYPIVSDDIFLTMHELLVERPNESTSIAQLSLGLYYTIANCDRSTRDQRERVLREVIGLAMRELSKFRRVRLAADTRDYFSKLVHLCECIKCWPFITAAEVSNVLMLLLALSESLEPRDPSRSILTRVIFGIYSYRKDCLVSGEIASFLETVTENEREFDSLVALLLSQHWYEPCSPLDALLRRAEISSRVKTAVIQRVVEHSEGITHYQSFKAVLRCLQHWPLLLNNCVTRVIAYCFSRSPARMQAALELYARVCGIWKTATTNDFLEGLRIAVRQDCTSESFGRVWELTTRDCSAIDGIDLIDGLSSLFESENDESTLQFLVHGLMRANLTVLQAQLLLARLAVIVERSQQLSSAAKGTLANSHPIIYFLTWLSRKYMPCGTDTEG